MKKKAKAVKQAKDTTPGNLINDVMLKDGNDVLILGMMGKPIQTSPQYPALVGYVNRMTGAYAQSIELAAKVLGMKIQIKTFIKVFEEDKPNGSV